MSTYTVSGDGRTPRTNTVLEPDALDVTVRQEIVEGSLGEVTTVAQVTAYRFAPGSQDAFPDVSEAIYLNLTADQAVHLMARLAACLDEKAISTYFGSPAKVTIDPTDDGLEGRGR